jgi:hypothetical protein
MLLSFKFHNEIDNFILVSFCNNRVSLVICISCRDSTGLNRNTSVANYKKCVRGQEYACALLEYCAFSQPTCLILTVEYIFVEETRVIFFV